MVQVKRMRGEISIRDRKAWRQMERSPSDIAPETTFASVHRQFSRRQESQAGNILWQVVEKNSLSGGSDETRRGG